MNERQSRRDIKWSRVALAGVVAGDVAGGWFLHGHNHLDIRAAVVVLCMFVGTLVIGAALAICHVITRGHEPVSVRPPKSADNVFPIRPDVLGEETVVLPLVVVGRAKPVGAGGPRALPRGRRLSYTAGDDTIDCFVREVLEQEGDAG